MVNIVDDIARQARQGSVAAIIQILNDRLAEIGVRTRAVFADGVLQLLCDPENQLLWSQEIKLRRVYFWQRFAIDQKERQGHKPALPKMTTHPRLSMQEPRQFQRGIIGGVSLSLLLLIALVPIYKALKIAKKPNRKHKKSK